MDLPNQDMNRSASSARHAYHTADYKVTKRQMAALWNRYYVWKALKEKDLKRESSSVTTIGPAGRGSRRAYQTASFDSFTVPVQRSTSHPAARRATQHSLRHGTTQRPTHSAYATTGSVRLTVI
ncbi:hypothetical protein BH10CYA1_BH10CYA1_38450 [soil metagenome]